MRNVTAPRSVNLMAFDNRLCPIWTIRFLSPMTTLSLGLSIFRKRFLSAASGMKSASSVSMTVCSLNGTGLTSSFRSPAENPNKCSAWPPCVPPPGVSSGCILSVWISFLRREQFSIAVDCRKRCAQVMGHGQHDSFSCRNQLLVFGNGMFQLPDCFLQSFL